MVGTGLDVVATSHPARIKTEVGHFLHVEGRVGDVAVCRGMFRTVNQSLHWE